MISRRDIVMTQGERIEFNHMTLEKILDIIFARMKKGKGKNVKIKVRNIFTKDILVGCGSPKQGVIELKFPVS